MSEPDTDALFQALTEARAQLQRAIDDLRYGRELGLVAFEAQRAAEMVTSLVAPHHAEPELSPDEWQVLWHVAEFYELNGRGCTLQELRRLVKASAKDAKLWSRALLRMGLVRKTSMGSRLVPGARRVARWRVVA